MNVINPENLKFPDKDSLPAPMPEVLTETQQNFVDFVKRNTKPDPNRTIDSYDLRTGELEVNSAHQLVPIDCIRTVNYVRVETEEIYDFKPPFPVPYNYNRVELKSDILGEVTALDFSSLDGWTMWLQDSDSVDISEKQAGLIVSTMLELESQGALRQK